MTQDKTDRTTPAHVAFIMDGNGRWAQARGLPRAAGHQKGAEAVHAVLRHAQKIGVRYVTLYAFSSGNWNRPPEEVDNLMGLFRQYLKSDVKELIKKKVRVRFLGDKERFDPDIRDKMKEIERDTAAFEDFHVAIAMNYGAREDIVAAVKRIAMDIFDKQYLVSAIDEQRISDSLSTSGFPDPDLIIRTSGEQRLSNFLLWEAAYAEFYFTPVFWPDFNEHDLDAAVEAYARRDRRFGKVARG
ncbi:MAG: polyprenyl diphosphate synthase [Alphaproteobacteria bacterium]|nr:polyprenyl diphosphate synthase [Alphaproteobacteria bacterium]